MIAGIDPFLGGVAIIALGVILLGVLLLDRSYGLFIGTQAVFQGAGYLILYRLLNHRLTRIPFCH